jgi:hypothetical protein
MVKPPNQLIETIEGTKQPINTTFIRPCAQTHHKANVVFTIHEPPCFMHDAS